MTSITTTVHVRAMIVMTARAARTTKTAKTAHASTNGVRAKFVSLLGATLDAGSHTATIIDTWR
jgi:hypothetical protein